MSGLRHTHTRPHGGLNLNQRGQRLIEYIFHKGVTSDECHTRAYHIANIEVHLVRNHSCLVISCGLSIAVKQNNLWCRKSPPRDIIPAIVACTVTL